MTVEMMSFSNPDNQNDGIRNDELHKLALKRGTIAREVLINLKKSPEWRGVNNDNKVLIEEVIASSGNLLNNELLIPEKLPQMKVTAAITYIRQAMQYHQEPITQHPQSVAKQTHELVRPIELKPQAEEPRQKRKYTRKVVVAENPTKTKVEENFETKDQAELFNLLQKGRLARSILTKIMETGGWKKISIQERENILKTYYDSQDIRGYTLLPEKRITGVSAKDACEQITQAARAKRQLVEKLAQIGWKNIDTKYSEHLAHFQESINQAVEQTLIEAKSDLQLEDLLKTKLTSTTSAVIRIVEAILKENEETKLIKQYNNLVHRVVGRVNARLKLAGIDYEDAVQEAHLMLLRTQQDYDDEKGGFVSYAYRRIYGRLMDLVRDHLPSSRYEQQHMGIIGEFEAKFMTIHGRKPTIEEVSESTGLKQSTIKSTLVAPTHISGDKPYVKGEVKNIFSTIIDDDLSTSPEEVILEKENQAEENQKYKTLRNALGHLPERLRTIVIRAELDNLSYREIGEELGISESRISQLHKKAMNELKQLILKPDVATKDTSDIKSLPLNEFLKEAGISTYIYQNEKLGSKMGIKRGKGRRIILTPYQQQAIKDKYAAYLENKDALKATRRAEKQESEKQQETFTLSENQSQGIKSILKAIPKLKDLEPLQFITLWKSGELNVSILKKAISPLTEPEQQTLIFRLSLVPYSTIARKFNTDISSVKIMEKAAIRGIKTRSGIVKFPSGEKIITRI